MDLFSHAVNAGFYQVVQHEQFLFVCESYGWLLWVSSPREETSGMDTNLVAFIVQLQNVLNVRAFVRIVKGKNVLTWPSHMNL